LYPAGLDDVSIKQGYSALGLELVDGEPTETISCSYVLTKDGKIIKEGNQFCRFHIENNECYNFSIVEQGVFQSGDISLEVTTSLAGYFLKEKRLLSLKNAVGSLQKEARLVSGKASVKVNAALLGISSPVFKAKLERGQQWLESQENSIDLGKDYEKYLKDLVDFLEEGEIDLDVANNNHYEKFRNLMMLGDMWKIESVLEFILIQLTGSPSKDDIVWRLLLLTRFKHIPMFNEGAKTLTLWAYINLNQKEFMDLTTRVFLLTNCEL